MLASPQNVTAQILLDGKGTVYANAAQLEYGACASDYNMILNGSFSNTDDWNWVKTEGVRYDDSASFWGPNAIQITGNLDEVRNAGQVVPVCQKRSPRETFTLSGWAKGTGVPVREREDAPTPTFRLRAVVHYADSDYDDFSEETFTADFSAHTDAWHYASIVQGCVEVVKWLVGEGLKRLIALIPAIGVLLGFFLGKIISAALDAILSTKFVKSITAKFEKTVNVKTYKAWDYLTTFFKLWA